VAAILIVLEGSDAVIEPAVREAELAGWTTQKGFDPPYRAGRVVRVGDVVDATDAAAALLAVLGGQGLVVRLTADARVGDRLVDDLRHLGPVDHRTGPSASAPEVPDDARAIIGLLAEGYSLGEAASILGLSRRTADRRLAEGRRALGVERTTEAITRARRLGWLQRGPGQDA
jgi:DNA-binding CsgD family transcriptional regulator